MNFHLKKNKIKRNNYGRLGRVFFLHDFWVLGGLGLGFLGVKRGGRAVRAVWGLFGWICISGAELAALIWFCGNGLRGEQESWNLDNISTSKTLKLEHWNGWNWKWSWIRYDFAVFFGLPWCAFILNGSWSSWYWILDCFYSSISF